MSAVGDELQRRKDEQRDQRLATSFYETRIRLFEVLERYAFESREIHPMERLCDGGLTKHPIGWVFYVQPLKPGRRLFLCEACHRRLESLYGSA